MLGQWRVAAIAAFTACAISAATADDGSRYAAIWVKEDGPGYIARHGLTSQQYQAEFDKLVGQQNYCLSLVSGYAVDGQARYAAIFEKKDCPQFVARHGLTSSQYQQEFDRWVGQGYRLKQVNGYTIAGQDRYAAIWERSLGPAFEARHGMTPQAYQREFDKWTSQGYCLTQVSGYRAGNGSRYAAIFEKNDCPAFVARHGLSSSAYQSEFDKWGAQGYRLVLVNGHRVDGAPSYSAIWHKAEGPAYIARHGLTSDQYQREFDKWTGQGYRLVLVSAF